MCKPVPVHDKINIQTKYLHALIELQHERGFVSLNKVKTKIISPQRMREKTGHSPLLVTEAQDINWRQVDPGFIL